MPKICYLYIFQSFLLNASMAKLLYLHRAHIIKDLTAALKQTRCTSPCCCPAVPEQPSWGQWLQSWLLHTSVRHSGHSSCQKYTLSESLICCCSIDNKLWHHHKKKSQVLLYFLHTKSPRFPLEIAVWCAPALKTVLVTALKYGSPQVIRKATHGNS